MQSLLLVLGAFLVGSLPFSFWVARRASGVDLRTVGSGNPGATNVLRAAGRKPAALALVLDIAKGVLPVIAAIELDLSDATVAAVAVAAIGGHILSPFLGLRGGKGVATSVGALAVLNPIASIAGVFTFLALVAWKRYVSLGSTVAAVVIAAVAAALPQVGPAGEPGAVAAVVIAVVVVVRHLPNLRRLRMGQEPRLGEKVSQT